MILCECSKQLAAGVLVDEFVLHRRTPDTVRLVEVVRSASPSQNPLDGGRWSWRAHDGAEQWRVECPRKGCELVYEGDTFDLVQRIVEVLASGGDSVRLSGASRPGGTPRNVD